MNFHRPAFIFYAAWGKGKQIPVTGQAAKFSRWLGLFQKWCGKRYEKYHCQYNVAEAYFCGFYKTNGNEFNKH